MSTASSANQTGMGSVAGGVAAGAAAGAAMTSWSGPGAIIGAAVGAVVGGIGGAIGLGNKAKKAAKRARAIQQERERNAEGAQYLAMIRQARLARAGSLAASTTYGIATSSLATSALSSIGSQSQYSVQFTANDERLLELYKKYAKKAGTYSKAAQTTLTTGQVVGTVLGTVGAFAGAAGAASSAAESLGSIGPYLPYQQAMIDSAYSSALQSGLFQTSLMTQVSSPIVQGVSQYNQI